MEICPVIREFAIAEDDRVLMTAFLFLLQYEACPGTAALLSQAQNIIGYRVEDHHAVPRGRGRTRPSIHYANKMTYRNVGLISLKRYLLCIFDEIFASSLRRTMRSHMTTSLTV